MKFSLKIQFIISVLYVVSISYSDAQIIVRSSIGLNNMKIEIDESIFWIPDDRRNSFVNLEYGVGIGKKY